MPEETPPAKARIETHIPLGSSLWGRGERVLRPAGHPLLLGCSIPRPGGGGAGRAPPVNTRSGGKGGGFSESEPELSLAVEMDQDVEKRPGPMRVLFEVGKVWNM